ncbi:hypothetical protein AB0M86_46815, partial [Streptomyces sp. NPDC051639]|uniref:hypothetical protein n=1 Tax=Streptomyces sp. NPDC051639 TaxID=3155671 RepID=UPI00341754FE
MKRWTRRLVAIRGRTEEFTAAANPVTGSPSGQEPVLIEEIDGIHVVRAASEPSPDPMSVAELGYTMSAQAGTIHTILAGTENEQVWGGLAEVLGGLRLDDDTDVLLVMSHAATGLGGQPAAARRIAERWSVRVTAPDGVALLVPGGSLFVPQGPRLVPDGAPSAPAHAPDGLSGSGWWRFTPGRNEPEPAGRQLPEPSWQTEADRLCAGPTGRTVAHRIPAGVLCRPKDAPPPRPDDLSFAVPVSQTRMVILVGAAEDEVEVSPRDVVDLLTPLSPSVRSKVLLAPGRNIDLLSAGQTAADTFNIEVEVLTGAPVMTEDPLSVGNGHRVRTVLLGTDGAPTWHPFVEAVACRPAAEGRAEPPRLLRWQPPVPGLDPARTAVVRLSDHWQVATVRSGLRITRTSDAPDVLPNRQVDADGPAIELGVPGRPLGGSVLPLLDRLLAAVAPEARERAVLYVYGECGAEQMRELSRMMAAHGIRRLRTRPPASAGRRPAPATTTSPTSSAAPSAASAPSPPTARATPPIPPRTMAPSLGSVPPWEPADGSVTPPRQVPTPKSARSTGPPPAPGHAPTGGNVRPSGPAAPEPTPGAAEAARPPGPASDSAAGEAAPRNPAKPEGPVPRRGEAGPRRPSAPLRPNRHASEAARAGFRALIPVGIRSAHEAAVSRVLDSLAVAGSGGHPPDPTDLLAVRLYLTGAEIPLDDLRVTAALHDRDPRLLSYVACLASGLNQLPRHRGVVLRAGSPPTPAEAVTGRVLRAPGPVSALPVARAGRITATRCAIWSEYGRRVGPLLSDIADSAAYRDEVVFRPGSAFRVLGVHEVRDTDVILLREVPLGTPSARALDERDRAVLTVLTGALAPLADLPKEDAPTGTQGTGARWPMRCS